MKIQFNELSDICKPNIRCPGGSASQMFFAKYKNQDVAIKAQKKGSLSETNPNDDRFEQEKKVLSFNFPHIVKMIGYGDDFDGERFLVLERLNELPGSIDIKMAQQISDSVLLACRKLFLNGFRWQAVKKHIMLDANSNPKLIDFNDGVHSWDSFFSANKNHDFTIPIKEICSMYNYDEIFDKSFAKVVEEEYPELDNIHQPIYFSPFQNIEKTITEENDKRFGQRAPANRTCTDRGDILLKALGENRVKGKTCLDIGTNAGWFPFFLGDHGMFVKGVDYDVRYSNGKIRFNKMMAEKFNHTATFEHADVNLEYVRSMDSYDTILALGILHLYFEQHKVTKEYWIEMFTEICKKARQAFIFEISPVVFKHLDLKGFGELADFAQKVGGFKSHRTIGRSLEGRFLIMCER